MNNQTVIRQMVRKDIELHRDQVVFTMVIGAAALCALLVKSEPVSVVGGIVFYIALAIIGCMLAATNLLNERKKQTLAFMMSLPVSAKQYTTAKVTSTMVMYLVPWAALVAAAVWLIAFRGVLPMGTIPVVLIMLTLPLVCMSLIFSITLVGETEGWNMAANVLCNSSHGLIWYFITRTPSLMKDLSGKAAVWNSTARNFLACELAITVLAIALAYYLQSRKRDFI